MPGVLLPAPHFEQSRDGTCLPACARMVLAYWGRQATEVEIADLLGAQVFGTAISNVARLTRLGYAIQHSHFDLDRLHRELDDRIPVIVRLWTGFLDYWAVETSHVAVVVGIDDDCVYLNDPAFPDHPQRVAVNSFLAAWAEYDETAVVIKPR